MDTVSRYPYVHVEVSETEAPVLTAELWELGALGVEERDATTIEHASQPDRVLLIASFADNAQANGAIQSLNSRFDAWLQHVVGDEWKYRWRSYFKPTRIGRRILLCPSWDLQEPRSNEVRIVIDPGGAFGSGIHETTRLVLAGLDRIVQGAEQVLDVGCGSGILSIAAIQLGAKHAIAIDVDEAAREATEENAYNNEMAGRIDTSTSAIGDVTGQFSILVANIRSEVLIPMAPALIERMTDGGHLLLSGILQPETEDVVRAYQGLLLEKMEAEGVVGGTDIAQGWR